MNPTKRHKDGGHYLDNSEWTAISDIGKPQYNHIIYEDYEKIESAYVLAIKFILSEQRVTELNVEGVELQYKSKKEFFDYKQKYSELFHKLYLDYENDIAPLKNGYILRSPQIGKTIRLILREIIWMFLKAPKITIAFGYDYYIYVSCPALTDDIIKAIEGTGLFVEQIKNWPWDSSK